MANYDRLLCEALLNFTSGEDPTWVFTLYLVSRCTVWERQNRQNFLSSNRSCVFDLFLVVT
jgi:hypothetical protein